MSYRPGAINIAGRTHKTRHALPLVLGRTMRKIYVLAILIVAIVSLVGTGSRFSDIVAEHLQSVSTGRATPARSVWDWIEYVREAWVYELDYPGELCQQPYLA